MGRGSLVLAWTSIRALLGLKEAQNKWLHEAPIYLIKLDTGHQVFHQASAIQSGLLSTSNPCPLPLTSQAPEPLFPYPSFFFLYNQPFWPWALLYLLLVLDSSLSPFALSLLIPLLLQYLSFHGLVYSAGHVQAGLPKKLLIVLSLMSTRKSLSSTVPRRGHVLIFIQAWIQNPSPDRKSWG